MTILSRCSGSARRAGALLAATLAASAILAAATAACGGSESITADTRLDYDRLGPIRIGMTLAEARRASGLPLPYTDSKPTPGCGWADLTPKSLGAALGIVDGVVTAVQLRRSPILVRGGGRTGYTLRTLHRRYGERLRRDHPNPYVRTLTRGTYRVVFSVDGRHPVDVITAGRRPEIDYNNLCT